MDETLHLGPVGQIARRVKDIHAARQWYGEVLGLKHLYSFGDLAFFDCGGTRLFLSQDAGAEQGESILYFRVPDIRHAFTTLSSRGAGFEGEPHLLARMPDHDLWMAFFRDPDRNLLALMSEVPRP